MVMKDMMCVNDAPLISLSFPRPSHTVFDRIRTTVHNATCEKCPDPGFEAVPIVQNINMLFKKSCMDTNYIILYVKPVTISLGCICAMKDWTICKLCLHALLISSLIWLSLNLQYAHIILLFFICENQMWWLSKIVKSVSVLWIMFYVFERNVFTMHVCKKISKPCNDSVVCILPIIYILNMMHVFVLLIEENKACSNNQNPFIVYDIQKSKWIWHELIQMPHCHKYIS